MKKGFDEALLVVGVHGPEGHLVAVLQRFVNQIGRYIRHVSPSDTWQGKPTSEEQQRTERLPHAELDALMVILRKKAHERHAVVNQRPTQCAGAGTGAGADAGASPRFTLNQAAYSAGRKKIVRNVATVRPPMIAIAIGPQNTLRVSGIIARTVFHLASIE